jgi:hypothetical protein
MNHGKRGDLDVRQSEGRDLGAGHERDGRHRQGRETDCQDPAMARCPIGDDRPYPLDPRGRHAASGRNVDAETRRSGADRDGERTGGREAAQCNGEQQKCHGKVLVASLDVTRNRSHGRLRSVTITS